MGHEIKGGTNNPFTRANQLGVVQQRTLSLQQTVGALTEGPDRPRGGWGMEAAGLRATCATLLPRSCCTIHGKHKQM